MAFMKTKFHILLLGIVLSLNTYGQNPRWIDMGTTSDNGGVLYWAASELVNHNNKIVLANEGEEGSLFWLGDTTGSTTNSPLAKLANPPIDIRGNTQYDIVSVHLGNACRLPSPSEFNKLIENSDIEYAEYKRSLDGVDGNGVPLWIQGQWFCEGINQIAFSFKFDGPFVSVIKVSDGPVETLYEGAYSFSQNVITFWEERLELDMNNKRLIRRGGENLKKVSNESSKTITRGYLFTSKINGNKLFFAIPPIYSSGRAGNAIVSFENKKEGDYWTGNLLEEGNEFYGTFFRVNDEGNGIVGNLLNEKQCYIKPVKTLENEIGNDTQIIEDSFLKKFTDTKSFIEKFYNDYIFGENNFYEISKTVCTPKMLNYLKEQYEYDCEDGECYALWCFRSGAQDGINDVSKVVKVETVGDGWYKVTYFDMGYKYATKVKIIQNNSLIQFDEIGETEEIEHEKTFKAYLDSINKATESETLSIQSSDETNVSKTNIEEGDETRSNAWSILVIGIIFGLLLIFYYIKNIRKNKS